MLENTKNQDWQIEFFNFFATEFNDRTSLEKADKVKIEHFPPVLGKYYDTLDLDELQKSCNGNLKIRKANLSENYNNEIIKVDYEQTIKTQLNPLVKEQIKKLKQEDPNFLSFEEEETIKNSDFPFIKLMTLVYSKDTNQMTSKDQEQWKDYMNKFINQQIIFCLVNTYYTVNLYQNNFYTCDLQTPYNTEDIWNKYANNQEGYCITYDFKEITEETAKQIQKIFPVLKVEKQLTLDDIDHSISNNHCASIIAVDDNVLEKDNSWEYIVNHKFTETEYNKLDSLLEPIYTVTINYPGIHEETENDHLEINDGVLEYNYKQIIDSVLNILESEDYKKVVGKLYNPVLNITSDELRIEYMKPEAIYLGLNFPEDNISEIKKLAEDSDVKLFRIKKSEDGILFKALL